MGAKTPSLHLLFPFPVPSKAPTATNYYCNTTKEKVALKKKMKHHVRTTGIFMASNKHLEGSFV